jgi:hypothetical protein
MLFMRIGGHLPFFSVNVMWTDLVSLTLIFHFFIHFSMSWSWFCRLFAAVIGFSCDEKMAVSSANVPVRCLGKWGDLGCRSYIGGGQVGFLGGLQRG